MVYMAKSTETAIKHGTDGLVNGVPKGWKPTPTKPVPAVQCTAIKANGERCKRFSLRGTTVCVKHGAQLPNVREHAEAVIEAARLRMLNNTDIAIDVLERLMEPGHAEGIMLKAATETLDRAGIRGGFEVDVEVDDKTQAAEIVKQRLEQLRGIAHTRAGDILGTSDTQDVVDVEVVEDAVPEGQLTIF